MKMKKIMLLAFTLAAVSLTACGGNKTVDVPNDSSVVEENTTNDDASAEDTAVKTAEEPDFMGFLVGDGDTEYINMSFDEFVAAAGSSFAKENGTSGDSIDDGVSYMQYSLGRMDSLLAGRVDLGKEYDVTCTLKIEDDKVKCVKETIEGITKDEAEAIANAFIEAFDGKLADGYVQFKPWEHGRKHELGFSKGVDDYVFSMTYDEDLDGEYFIYFSIQIYSERYGMK